ncbi:hypothetical protein TNCV_3226381 [Trichonephila clavipes]|nr:hypothetical protein TNCV_3226381 [Trichonephila clavipes]
MVSRQPTTEITPIYSPISTSEEIPFPLPSTSQTRDPIPFPLPSTSQTRDPIPFPRGLFHHDILNEALSSSGISETSISLGYHLGKRARNNRHSTKSHSSSSSDSRRRLVKHKSRHSRCSNREDEAKDEMELPHGVELFKYGILKRFMDKYIKHGSKVGIKLDADTLRFTCKLFSDIMIYHMK